MPGRRNSIPLQLKAKPLAVIFLTVRTFYRNDSYIKVLKTIFMKLLAVPLIFILTISVGNKCFSQCDRCDTLFEQIKGDKLFISFLATNESIVNLYSENAINSPRSGNLHEQDSIYMRDSSISIQEKFDSMGYKGLKVIQQLNRQSIETLAKLEEIYPLLKDLAEDEYPIFIKRSTEYYNSLKKQ